MATMMKPVALTIDLDIVAKEPPKELVQRLSSPPSSPSKENKHRDENAARLHSLAVEATKERAQRDVQRVADVQAAKLRAEKQAAERIERRAALADKKVSHKKAEDAKKREEAKQKYAERRASVLSNRLLASETKSNRAAVLHEAEQAASSRRTKVIDAAVEKSKAAVEHALAVVASQKEKRLSYELEAAENITAKLEAAESRRQTRLAAKPTSPTTGKHDVRHRVLNDASVAAGLKRRSLAAAMEKAAANHERHVLSVKDKASKHVEAVAEKAAAKAERDAAAVAKRDWTAKMISAQISRMHELKKRYGALGREKDCPQLVVVGDFEATKAAAPPAALLRRLVAKPTTLLATAPARHSGAAARLRALAASRSAKAAKTAIKVAAAAAKRGAARAATLAAIEARGKRSLCVLSLRDAARKRTVGAATAKRAAAVAKRAAATTTTTAKYEACGAKCAAAAEKRAFAVQCRAKTGLVAIQKARIDKNRAALAVAKAVAAALKLTRCEKATATLGELTAAKVATAKKYSAKRAPAPADAMPVVA